MISSITSVPLDRVLCKKEEQLVVIEKELGATVIGQQEAIAIVANHLRRVEANLQTLQ